MNEVTDFIVKSSEIYYDYLKENNKGIIVFDVVKVERVLEPGSKKKIYRLRLEKKLGSTESVMLQVLEKQYLPTQVKVLMWDEENKDLFVQIISKTAKEELSDFEGIDVREIKVIVDLKFLVARVGAWFKTRNCKIPHRISGFGEIRTYNDCSPEQKEAVDFCLNQPLSYVWGAPGTGKTKFVLANAVLNCFYAGQKVLIAAPTNNAIEQVLRGLIEQFDRIGIGRDNILRLGSPSKAFAEEFPETCEIRGISEIMSALADKKALLDKILVYKKEKAEFDEYKASLNVSDKKRLPEVVRNMLDEMEKVYAEKAKLYSEYEDSDIADIENELKALGEKLAADKSGMTDARIRERQIIGCTIDGYIGYCCLDEDGENGKELPIDRIFLDEASYCSAAKAATLFSAGVPITFLGDHFQLPPVCEADDDLIADEDNRPMFIWAQSALFLPEFIGEGAETSYLRYAKKQLPDFAWLLKFDLTVTYRFGQNLLDILSKSVYRSRLKSHESKENIEIICIDAPQRTVPIRKRENADEALAIKNYLQKNIMQLGSTAILTPYKNQLTLLRKTCFRSLYENIFTVHGSQGREFDTVILSVSDTSNKYFTDSNNLKSGGKLILNTAISRAKKRLIIVCDKTYWQSQTGQLLCELVTGL